MKLISIDFDEVLYNLKDLSKDFIKEHYNDTIVDNDITHWEFFTSNYPEIFRVYGDENIYSKGTLIDGSIAFIEELINKYGKESLQIVTNSFPGVVEYKNHLIKRNFYDIDVVHTLGDKTPTTSGTILIDDGVHNIDRHIKDDNIGILFDRDSSYYWNKDYICNSDYRHLFSRATSYDECLEKIHIKLKV